MPNLVRTLRKDGWDFIQSNVRDITLGQIWKKSFAEPTVLYDYYTHLFEGNEIEPEISRALPIYSETEQKFSLNLGISFLQQLFSGIGLGPLNINAKGRGKTIIKFDNIRTRVFALNQMEIFFEEADFVHPNRTFLETLYKDDLIFIGGVMEAKTIKIKLIKTNATAGNVDINADEFAEANINVEHKSETETLIEYNGSKYFPIAVKSFRIKWSDGFDKLVLTSDNRNFF